MSTLEVTYPQVRNALKIFGYTLVIVLLVVAGIKFGNWLHDYQASYAQARAATTAQLQQYYGQNDIAYNPDRNSAVVTTPTCRATFDAVETSAGTRLAVSFAGYTTTFTRESLAAYLGRCAQGIPPTQS